MKAYGIEKKDRMKCCIKGCGCGDMSSKHPKDCLSKPNMDRRMKKHARQVQKKEIVNGL